MITLKRHRLLAVTLPALLTLALSAPAAFAAPAAQWSSIEVRWILGSDGTPAVLVAGELPAAAKLPAAVQLGVPNGTQITWAGEIVGTDPSKDPAVQYTTKPENGYDQVDFTLSKAPRAQVEYDAPSTLVTNGDSKTISLAWTSPVDAPAVSLTVQPPSGAKVSDAGGAKPDAGGTTYTKTFTAVKAGQKLELEFAYSGGTVAPAAQPQAQPGVPAQAGGSDTTSALAPVIVLGLLLMGTFFFLKLAGMHREQAADEATVEAAAGKAPAPKSAGRKKPAA